MENSTYRFRVGTFECMAVSDGMVTYPQSTAEMFPAVPQEQIEQVVGKAGTQPREGFRWQPLDEGH